MKLRAGPAAELGANLLLPWLAYRLALPHWGMAGALYASAVPPVAWSAMEFARTRRVDAVSAVVLLGIGLSLAAMMLGGSPRLLLLRESLVSGVVGIVFLLSLGCRRTLVFYLARATFARESADGHVRFESLWQERASLRVALRQITLVWGLGLTGENLLRAWLAWHWPIERYLVLSPLIGYALYGGLIAWTLWCRERMRRRGEIVVAAGTPSIR
ncbi:hypothetical protein BKK79_03150 [Cupriavidus sp. USMAA2-4]|uniref:Transmembrane protein n=1 Tax=Cupriavidus malaysiensis TaxID=367825 RepID=A0ABM6F3W4_9BURK|nr:MULTISPECIES: VC0807 family protein [Cupriavidus]AOY90922.1 hypothetical protein BKK79_03150 [Cupriavidus sp. USMAA2-4]AOY99505.1 hypothetical protein BKK81_09685 [Cupriavidus sp. USMAHM13]AOZ06122.1 hypothetical protein BKK80_09970 [Cupriavidus malaysiensis]